MNEGPHVPRHEPITVTVQIDLGSSSLTVTKRQRVDFRGRPIQKLSDVWKEAMTDVNPFVRRHDTMPRA